MAAPTKAGLAGSIPVCTVLGVRVYVHWTWLPVALVELQFRNNSYSSEIWNVAEYLTLFAVVLLHEFGHALACRQVGGRADQVVLWPLGGIAFVQPPPRPGAWLWSIAAGPLVNVLLVPVTIGAYVLASQQGLADTNPDADAYLHAVLLMNLCLLIFNLLPIYPLDGGQILQALLWFVIGQARSLLVVCVIGIVAAVGMIGLAVALGSFWIGIMAVFAAARSWAGLQQALVMIRFARAPKHAGVACPACRMPPLMGSFWMCDQCHARFDTFVHAATCPRCGKEFASTGCPACHQSHPIAEWSTAAGRAPADGALDTYRDDQPL